MGFSNCSMFCCALLYVLSSFAIILMGNRELFALLCLSRDCCVALLHNATVLFVIVLFPVHIYLLFLNLLL